MFGGAFGGMVGRGPDLIRVASDPAVQEKLGIAGKKADIDKLATDSREAGREAFAGLRNTRDMDREERTKLFEKMRAARTKAQEETAAKLKDLLGKAKHDQLVRIQAGLMLRETGPMAVLDPGIGSILKLTDEQKKKIQEAVEKYNEDRSKLSEGFRRDRPGGQRGPRGGESTGGPRLGAQVIFVAAEGGAPDRPNFDEIRAKIEELRKALNKAISAILTKAQKDEVTALMKAAEGIEIQRPQFGRGGRPGGGEGARPGGRPGGGEGARPGGRPGGRPSGRPGGGQGGRRPGGGDRPAQ
jgi:hypothetical protein